MDILPKVSYKNPHENINVILSRARKANLKFTWKYKILKKSILSKKSNTRRVVMPAFKIDDNAIVSAWYGHKSRLQISGVE